MREGEGEEKGGKDSIRVIRGLYTVWRYAVA